MDESQRHDATLNKKNMYHRRSLIADQELPQGAVAIAPWVNCVVPRQEDLSIDSQH